MTYVIGAIVGLLFGAIVGHLKNRFVWGKYMQRDADSESASRDLYRSEASALYSRMLISNMLNLATLAAAFFLQKLLPFDGIAFLIGTAAALVLMNKVLSIGQKKKEDH